MSPLNPNRQRFLRVLFPETRFALILCHPLAVGLCHPRMGQEHPGTPGAALVRSPG
jgi:hypothetical protein